jgi:hypothetical protein
MGTQAVSKFRTARSISDGHVVPRVVVEEDYEDTEMMTTRRQNDEIVKGFKVLVIPSQDRPAIANGVSEVTLVDNTDESDIRGDLNIMAIAAQNANQARIDAVVVNIQSHKPSLARSSVVRARGLPLRQMEGSFMPIASRSISSLR